MHVGDDVVDLADPETRAGAQHPRFDERVFSRPERAWICAQLKPHAARWTLWAAKESAFKLARKLDPGAIFSPVQLCVHGPQTQTPWVSVAGRRAAVHVERIGSCVHALVSLPELDAVSPLTLATFEPGTSDNPSHAVRRFALGALGAHLGCDAGVLRIVRKGRIPQLYVGASGPVADLSLAHHGRFVSFACALSGPYGTRLIRSVGVSSEHGSLERLRDRDATHDRGAASLSACAALACP